MSTLFHNYLSFLSFFIIIMCFFYSHLQLIKGNQSEVEIIMFLVNQKFLFHCIILFHWQVNYKIGNFTPAFYWGAEIYLPTNLSTYKCCFDNVWGSPLWESNQDSLGPFTWHGASSTSEPYVLSHWCKILAVPLDI